MKYGESKIRRRKQFISKVGLMKPLSIQEWAPGWLVEHQYCVLSHCVPTFTHTGWAQTGVSCTGKGMAITTSPQLLLCTCSSPEKGWLAIIGCLLKLHTVCQPGSQSTLEAQSGLDKSVSTMMSCGQWVCSLFGKQTVTTYYPKLLGCDTIMSHNNWDHYCFNSNVSMWSSCWKYTAMQRCFIERFCPSIQVIACGPALYSFRCSFQCSVRSALSAFWSIW